MSPSGVTSAFDAFQSAAAIDLNPINCQSHRANDYLPCPYSSSIPVVNYSHSMCLQCFFIFFFPTGLSGSINLFFLFIQRLWRLHIKVKLGNASSANSARALGQEAVQISIILDIEIRRTPLPLQREQTAEESKWKEEPLFPPSNLPSLLEKGIKIWNTRVTRRGNSLDVPFIFLNSLVMENAWCASFLSVETELKERKSVLYKCFNLLHF